jgi:hypothetical protein
MTYFNSKTGAALLLCGALALPGLSSANTISLTGYNGPSTNLTCNGAALDACMGFVGIGPTTLSNTIAQNYDDGGPSNLPTELAQLNLRLADFDPVRSPIVLADADKTDVAGGGFVVDTQYFSIKKQNFLWFFENTSGGSLTVAMQGDNYSHWTKYGDTVSEVPLPAAAWLFGSGLIALVGLKRRK